MLEREAIAHADDLDAHVVGAGIEVALDMRGDRLLVAERHEVAREAVAAAQVLLAVPEALQVRDVVGQPQVVSDERGRPLQVSTEVDRLLDQFAETLRLIDNTDLASVVIERYEFERPDIPSPPPAPEDHRIRRR